MCFVADPFLHIAFLSDRQGAHSGFGGWGRRHVELHVQVSCKHRVHLPVRAQLQMKEETVRVAWSYQEQTQPTVRAGLGKGIQVRPKDY